MHCVNDIGSAYGWSSSLDVCLQSVPIETVIAGSTFVRELSSRYRLTSHADAHGLGSTAATLCNDPYLDSEPVPHINVGIYDTSNGVYIYNLHVGRIQRNNQDCTVVYESANRFCREYCGSERKKPGDVIRGPPVPYPYPIPTGTMDDLLRHHNIYSNPDWPSTFPIQLITILGLIILIVITIGACAISLGTVCPAA